MYKKVLVICLMLPILGSAYAADDKRIRCGNGLVTKGMTFEKVSKTCGALKPFSKTPYKKSFVSAGFEVKEYNYVVWEFHQHGKFRMYINFFEGRVNKFWADHSIRD